MYLSKILGAARTIRCILRDFDTPIITEESKKQLDVT